MKILTRRSDAAGRLAELMKQRANKSFIWGVRDCMLFVGDAIHAMTGEDVARTIRGTYYDEPGALREIERLSDSGCLVEYLGNFLSAYGGVIEDDRKHGAVCIVNLFGKQFGGVLTSSGVVMFQPTGYMVTGAQNIEKSWGF